MYIGIDLGGSKIEGIALSLKGEQLLRERIETPVDDYLGIIAAVVTLVGRIEESTEQHRLDSNDLTCQIGIGTPGSVSQLDGTMKNCNSTCLNGRFFAADLEAALGRPLRLANDANCFTLSEAVDGAGKDSPVVFGVILGTGVGGGIVVNGRLLGGPNAIGSEWGHNTLPGVGTEFEDECRRCYCGRANCIETYLSGPGLAETYRRLSGEVTTAEAVASAAGAGDNRALKALAVYQQQLAYSLSQVVNIIDPDVIVLGGGVSNIPSLYSKIPQLWAPYIFSDTVGTQLLPAAYGDSSGVRGAAWLWAEPLSPPAGTGPIP